MTHVHCESCINLNCKFRECKLIRCENGCEFRMHECKQQDHLFICAKAKVPCINSLYGCTLILLRMNLSRHLEHCPASVVHCPFEWSRPRWKSDGDSESNLETALAERDQSMLKDRSKYKKLLHRLRKCQKIKDCPFLCPYYLQLPIEPYLSGREKILWKNPLTKCSSFVSTTSNTASTLTCSDDDSSESSPFDVKKSPPGLRKSLCEKLMINSKSSAKNKELSIDEEAIKYTTSSSSEDENELFQSKSLNYNTDTKNEKKREEHSNSLILDTNVEYLAPYQPRPKKMFTFRCASDFRRDEISYHFKNVHCEIMGSLCFLIKKCPNKQYGCPFFVEHVHPLFNKKKSKIIFSQLNKGFGHQVDDLDDHQLKNDCQMSLIDLPLHIILKIINYLDGFSINNLSRTNKSFRFLIGNYYLESRGLVNLIWMKCDRVDRPHEKEWTIVGYKWTFSNSMDEIKEWTFDGQDKMLNHILNCEYFNRIERKEPYALVGMTKKFDITKSEFSFESLNT